MIHAIVRLTVEKPAVFEGYAAKAGAGLAKWGAAPVAVTAAPELIEGKGPLPGRIVILSFPDRQAALGWINDPELAEVHALRRASGPGEIALLA